jgi:exoribonuclease R
MRRALDLDLPGRVVLDEETGAPLTSRAVLKIRASGAQLVEELMLLATAGRAVVEQAARPTIYRVHDRPDEEAQGSASLKLGAAVDTDRRRSAGGFEKSRASAQQMLR